MDLNDKEKQILELLTKETGGLSAYAIAKKLHHNSNYNVVYLAKLEKMGLIKKTKKEYAKVVRTYWEINDDSQREKTEPVKEN